MRFPGLFVLCVAVHAACAGNPVPADAEPLRIAVRVDRGDVAGLSSLSYGGGFETKTWLYETLIRRDEDGVIVPGLAESWEFDDPGTTVWLTLREGATFHDGTACDASAVRDHFGRWLHEPNHAWLGAGHAIRSVDVDDARTVRITLDRPYALLPDLCATNPCAILAPGAFDDAGAFLRPVGTGPFRYLSTTTDGRMHVYERPADGLRLELVCYGTHGTPVDDLLADRLDAVVDGWIERVPRDRIAELSVDPRFTVTDTAGSCVVYLSFNFQPDSPTATTSVRRRIAAAIDRQALCAEAELGHADPCDAWGAPTVRSWPRPSAADHAVGMTTAGFEQPGLPLRLLLQSGHRTENVGLRVAEQLRRAGFEVQVDRRDRAAMRAAVDAGAFDLRLEETWGLPYDPMLSLRARFLPPPSAPTAATFQHTGLDPRLVMWIERASAATDQDARREEFGAIQSLLTREALIVPLLVPHRVAVVRRGIEAIRPGADLYRLEIR